MGAGAPTEVEIFGRRYRLRSTHESSDVAKLAAFVDGRMRLLAQHVPQADSAKLAVLVALNIAEELFRESEMDPGARTEMIRERVEGLIAKIDAALGASP
ncbi:MAG: cell division protein ZapA [Thermoanaerobaculum sp.]|nr:cell division protein ZapA [Thermoanaerobaculum sp.]